MQGARSRARVLERACDSRRAHDEPSGHQHDPGDGVAAVGTAAPAGSAGSVARSAGDEAAVVSEFSTHSTDETDVFTDGRIVRKTVIEG